MKDRWVDGWREEWKMPPLPLLLYPLEPKGMSRTPLSGLPSLLIYIRHPLKVYFW